MRRRDVEELHQLRAERHHQHEIDNVQELDRRQNAEEATLLPAGEPKRRRVGNRRMGWLLGRACQDARNGATRVVKWRGRLTMEHSI
jgi:hypothetical protein